ncbi:MAG: hypothetical protein OXC63_00170 [Aestuariivita sp.]|nr:hypothetical protein [Aestuariivita sp.]MCY4347648.1 hypothetical protein [Aestuariivita sp.]
MSSDLNLQQQDDSQSRLHVVQPNLSCPMCGEENVITEWYSHTFEYGSGEATANLTATVPARQCRTCDFENLDYAAERLKHNAICNHLGVLSP